MFNTVNFFQASLHRLLYAIVKIAITTARIILHLISYPQFTYDLFHMHHSLTVNDILMSGSSLMWYCLI